MNNEIVIKYISSARFQKFLNSSNQSQEAALALYQWNSDLGAEFLKVIHHLEIALRNGLSEQLTIGLGSQWPSSNVFINKTQSTIKQAKKKTSKKTIDDLIPQLSFGFWRYLLSPVYEKNLWVPFLHKAFQPKVNRDYLYKNLLEINRLRNRIAHNEPIYHEKLLMINDQLKFSLKALNPVLEQWVTQNSKLPIFLSRKPT